MLKLILLFSSSTERINALISSPTVRTWAGFSILSWLIFELWTRPSTPGSNSTNAAKSLILTTFPKTTDPSGYFSLAFDHGSGVNSLMLKESFLASLSRSIILTSIISPLDKTSSTLLTCFHEIWDKWSKPSTPLTSTNAPKFVNLLTSPLTTSPTLNEAHAFSSFAACSASNITLLEAIILLCLPVVNSISLTVKVWPF